MTWHKYTKAREVYFGDHIANVTEARNTFVISALQNTEPGLERDVELHPNGRMAFPDHGNVIIWDARAAETKPTDHDDYVHRAKAYAQCEALAATERIGVLLIKGFLTDDRCTVIYFEPDGDIVRRHDNLRLAQCYLGGMCLVDGEKNVVFGRGTLPRFDTPRIQAINRIACEIRSGDCTMTTSDFYYKVAVEEVREWELRRAQFTLFAPDLDEQREYTRALDRLKGYKELRRAGEMDNIRVTVIDAIRRATDTPSA